MTQAQQIAERFGNDGATWYDIGGNHLDEVCEARVNRQWRHSTPDDETYRYQFTDGSAIVVAGDAWDLEGTETFSWAGLEG
jgi:hypothetical protein